MRERPIGAIQALANGAGRSFPAASAGMTVLENLGIARELTGKKRNRLFGYNRYLAILGERTEPL